jgi:hypothetical protein
MKRNILIIIYFLSYFAAKSQSFSIANEKMNIMYLGVDNPISIAVEGIRAADVIVKSTNGTIDKEYGNYIARPNWIGVATIRLYQKAGGKLKLIGEKPFKVKMIPNPVFKIGSGRSRIQRKEIAAQEWARADIENIDIDLNIGIEEFTMQVYYKDSATLTIINKGNKLSDGVKHALTFLKPDDTIIFSDIYAHVPWARHLHLDDVLVKIAPDNIIEPSINNGN